MTLTDDARAHAGDFDVLSNAAYSEGVPHDVLDRLRAESPIYHQEIPDPRLHDAAWVLTTYEDVMAISKDTERFGNRHGLNLRGDYSDDEPRHLLNVDNPKHLQMRRLTNKGFTPRVVQRYAEHYAGLAGQLLDEAIADGTTFDVVDRLAEALPLLAICELLGTTPDDRDQLVRWSNAIIANDDPEYSASAEARIQAGEEMLAYIAELEAARRANPQDDMATTLVQELDAGELAADEFYAYAMLLFVAGNETTRNNISHGMHQLAINPDQYAMLRAEPDRVLDTAVEEITRWASPVIYMSRTVLEDAEYKGIRFTKGERVVLHYAAANRDPAVFDDPQRFTIERDPNPHISFGFGHHFCLGAHLARLETKCLLQEFAKRVESFELAGRPEHVRSSFIAGIKRLPITVTLA